VGLWAFSAIGLYCAVWFEYRYVEAFVAIALLALLLRQTKASRQPDWVSILQGSILVTLSLAVIAIAILQSREERWATAVTWTSEAQVASYLHAHNVHPGDHVAVIGWANGATYAQLAGVQISSVLLKRQMHEMTPTEWDGAIQVWRKAGIRAVLLNTFRWANAGGVLRPPPEWSGMTPVPNTSYFLRIL
jgi:hypothetical protein